MPKTLGLPARAQAHRPRRIARGALTLVRTTRRPRVARPGVVAVPAGAEWTQITITATCGVVFHAAMRTEDVTPLFLKALANYFDVKSLTPAERR